MRKSVDIVEQSPIMDSKLISLNRGGNMVFLGLAVQVCSHQLEVSFEPEKSYIEGKAVVELTGEVEKELVFYLHSELMVDSIIHRSNNLEYAQGKVLYRKNYSLVANTVSVNTDSIVENEPIEIYYSGFFNPSRSRSPSDYMRIMPGEVLLRSYGYSLWFPVFLTDDQDSYRTDFRKVQIKAPEDLVSVFVGTKLNEYTEDGYRITEWQALDTDLFAAQCTAREYQILAVDNCYVYHLKDDISTDNAGNILKFVKEISESFRSRYKPDVKTEPLYVLQMPEYGDISSGNVIGINDNSWQDFKSNRGSQFLIAHELVHSYVKMDISQSNPLSALIVEGFPSYFFLPVLADMWGEDWYQKYTKKVEDYYLSLKQTGNTPRGWPIPEEKAILEITWDEIGVYKDCFILSDRVLLFFNYLRKSMGREKFYAFSKELLDIKDIDYPKLEELILKCLPGTQADIEIWLKQTDYPQKFHLKEE